MSADLAVKLREQCLRLSHPLLYNTNREQLNVSLNETAGRQYLKLMMFLYTLWPGRKYCNA